MQTEQSRNKKLAKDVIIYGIGNVGSRFLAAFVIPLLSFIIARKEIGYYDVATTTIFLLLPLTTLQMRESLFRLLIDNDGPENRKNVVSSTFFIESIIFAIIFIVSIFIPFLANIPYYLLIILSIYTFSFYELYIQFVRASYSPKNFAAMGIMTSALFLILSLSLIFLFNTGISGLFLGNILARIASIFVIEIRRREFFKYLSISNIKKTHIKETLNYSIPMLGSALAYGIITSCGKYIVKFYWGLEENGDLSIAEKYVTIISVLGLSFYQAWQETAVKNFKKAESSNFFSEVFNKYAMMLSLLVICISFGVRIFSFVLVGEEYRNCINVLYIYGIGFMFYCFAMFFEVIYQCTKQTSKILYSIVTCAVLTLPLSLLLIRKFGLMGNVTAICFAFAYLFIFRYFQTKKTLTVHIDKIGYISIIIIFVGGILFYCQHNKFIDFCVLLMSIYTLYRFSSTIKRFINKE